MKPLNLILTGVLAFGLCGLAGAQDKKDEKKDDNATKLVGKWEIVKAGGGAPVGTIIEFTKDGKMMAAIKIEGMDIKIDGTYKLEKDKLSLKMKFGGDEISEDLTIKKLTDEVLELEDKDKKVDELKRKK